MENNEIVNDLPLEENKVVEYLIEDWRKKYRVTNIKQGIEALGLPYKNDIRMRIGAYLKLIYVRKDDLSERLKKWGPETFILTNKEKLIARCLLLNFKQLGTIPLVTEIVHAVDLDEKQVKDALKILAQLGFLDEHRSFGHMKYKISIDYKKFLQGLGLTFHTLILEDGEKFNVQCSIDALILATGIYANQNIKIKDSCFHCLDKLLIIMRKGKVIYQNPPGIRLYEGTDCGSMNFFSYEEHFQEWITNLLPAEVKKLCGSGKKESISVKQFIDQQVLKICLNA